MSYAGPNKIMYSTPKHFFVGSSMVARLINEYEWKEQYDDGERNILHAHHMRVQMGDVGLWVTHSDA